MDEIECQYNLGNYIYTIRDTNEVHARLKSGNLSTMIPNTYK